MQALKLGCEAGVKCECFDLETGETEGGVFDVERNRGGEILKKIGTKCSGSVQCTLNPRYVHRM